MSKNKLFVMVVLGLHGVLVAGLIYDIGKKDGMKVVDLD